MDECGMLSAEIVPSVGSGCTLPPAMSGASASSSSTISAPCSVRVCQRHELLLLLVLGALEAHFHGPNPRSSVSRTRSQSIVYRSL